MATASDRRRPRDKRGMEPPRKTVNVLRTDRAGNPIGTVLDELLVDEPAGRRVQAQRTANATLGGSVLSFFCPPACLTRRPRVSFPVNPARLFGRREPLPKLTPVVLAGNVLRRPVLLGEPAPVTGR